MRKAAHRTDADALLVRRTAIRVGLWITVAVSVLVMAVMVAAISFVFHQIPLTALFDRTRHEEMIDVGGLDIIVGGVALGFLAIILAGTLGLLATRRAVAPLVDALGRQRRFVADASHELRTPLAILDTRLQVLERSMPAGDPNRELVDELRGDSRNLINVVNDLLDSIDVTSSGVVASEPVAPVIADAATSMRLMAHERGIQLHVDTVPADRSAAIPPTSLHRALVALIDNAVKHSPDGEQCWSPPARVGLTPALLYAITGPAFRGSIPNASSIVSRGPRSRSTAGAPRVQDSVSDSASYKTPSAGSAAPSRSPAPLRRERRSP